jgi:hypothetical protein
MSNQTKILTFPAQSAKTSALRKLSLSSLVLLALTSAAYAQAGTDQMLKDKDAADSQAAKEFINRMQTEEQYQKTIREQPAAATPSDPWGTVRPTNAPNPAAKPAAKSAAGTAKTASGGKPAGGAIKPAAGAAASAGGSTQKGQ